MLRLEGAKRVHGMTMVDPFNNQLTREDDKGTADDEERLMRRQGTEARRISDDGASDRGDDVASGRGRRRWQRRCRRSGR